MALRTEYNGRCHKWFSSLLVAKVWYLSQIMPRPPRSTVSAIQSFGDVVLMRLTRSRRSGHKRDCWGSRSDVAVPFGEPFRTCRTVVVPSVSQSSSPSTGPWRWKHKVRRNVGKTQRHIPGVQQTIGNVHDYDVCAVGVRLLEHRDGGWALIQVGVFCAGAVPSAMDRLLVQEIGQNLENI
jgi:hypothetical protein